jgi:cell division septation protein DedD
MIKIIASILTLSLAFAAGVVLGAHQNRPLIKKIAARPMVKKLRLNPSRNVIVSTVKKSPLNNEDLKTADKDNIRKAVNSGEDSNSTGKYLNKKRTGYTVLLSSFKVEENANNYAKKISRKGYDAFYFSKEIQGKTWHRVGVGSFTTKTTAESLKKQLIENRLGKGSLISVIPKQSAI